MGRYRVLSLDGGGIRGIVSIILLQRLQAMDGLGGLLEGVDLFAGTSTGGLLALALAKGLGLETLGELYETQGAAVFDDSWLDDLLDLGMLTGAQYDLKNLAQQVKRVLGHTTLGELRRAVLVTSFDLDNEAKDPTQRRWKPKLFHNLPGAGNDSAWPAYKVALYTCAAPAYFPAVDGYIDGGVYASNPSMCALAQTQDPRNLVRPGLDEVALLSVGTGTNLTYIQGRSLDWGYAQWAQPLVSLMLDGVAGIADYQCRQLLGERYHRLAPCFPPGKAYAMDDAKRLGELVCFAQDVDLEPAAAWLREVWVGEED